MNIFLKHLYKITIEKIFCFDPNFKLNFGTQPYRYGQCMYMEGDTSRLRKNLYQLKTDDFEERLNETIQYYIEMYE